MKLVVGAMGSDEILQFWRLSVVKLISRINLPIQLKIQCHMNLWFMGVVV